MRTRLLLGSAAAAVMIVGGCAGAGGSESNKSPTLPKVRPVSLLPGVPLDHYTSKRVPNPSPNGVSWQQYHTVRNAVLRGCKRFGTAGGMGECPIVPGDNPPLEGWPLGDYPDPAFWVVDDQYNDERYIYLEVNERAQFTEAWVAAMMDVLREFPGWGIGVTNVRRGYMLIFSDKLMVNGPTFARSANAAEAVASARKHLH